MDAAGLLELLQASWPHLTYLILADNNFDVVATTALSQSSHCSTLNTLELDGNHPGEEGVAALILGQWDTLTTLCVEHCGISTHHGMQQLLVLLRHFPELRVLH